MRKLLSVGYSFLLRWLWLVRNYRPFENDLKRNHGVTQLRPVMARRWHRGSKYFRGVSADGKLLFIKMDGESRLLQNEVDAWMRLQQTAADSGHCARMHFFDFAGEYRIVAFDWVDGEPLSRFLLNQPAADHLCCVMREMAAILGELGRAGMIHRDFTPENLLVTRGPVADSISVVLIDFAFAAIADAAPYDRLVPLSDLRDLCHGYKAEEFLWDDAYSCLTIFEQIRRSAGVEDPACRNEVTDRLAVHTFSLDAVAARQERVGSFAPGVARCA